MDERHRERVEERETERDREREREKERGEKYIKREPERERVIVTESIIDSRWRMCVCRCEMGLSPQVLIG